ncbi:SusC/RagA family TonB-linked outer membrane protein [Pedobacter agri]|uniref:SusC/RagA family TonB-linked outer membrane protein n=1 Tax=Pedobacter agri TaxID=454586 RepID=UPI002788C0D2|nr:TonB-dependent receptor [Pedobacter agri]MDQ1139929.1 TonB-linked SusC/RagA family outer membrane protein [Pedobacter agri]
MKRIFTRISVLAVFFLLATNVAFAQNITVKGVVTDGGDKTTMPSVSVQVKGTQTGTQTDATGAYSISAPANATLVFTFVGYATQEVAVANRTTINVVLASGAKDLEQVVVVGYGTQRKKDVTGSISSVKGEEIEKFAVTNPIAALQGKVPGMTIANDGAPGSAPTVRLRGIASTKDSNPLYVVDGLLQDNIDYLNPNDIETIDVLRDASSTAIYGLRGANGVIAITTKRAARGKTTVNFQTTYGIQHVNNLIDVVDAAGFKKLYSAALANAGAAPFDFTNYTGDTNWQKEVLRTAGINTNSLSISNNNEKSTTLVSLGYNNQDGVVGRGNYQKFIARLNEEIRITDKIKIGADLTGFHFRNRPTADVLNSAIRAVPNVPVDNGAGLYNTMPSFQRAQVGNPVYAIDRNDQTSINRGYRFNGSLYAEIKFLKDFTWKSTVYTDLGFNNTRAYTPIPYRVVNIGEGAIPTSTFLDPTARTSIRQETFEGRKYQQDHTLNYDKVIKDDHRINALLGFTSIYTSSTTLSGSRTDSTLKVPFDSNLWYIDAIARDNITTNGGSGAEESNVGMFGRVSYSYKNKYLLNATIRRDASSRFAPQNRWGTFGSVGLGWVVSDEDFFKNNIKGIDFLKIRTAWGRLGNSKGVDANLYQQTISQASTAVFGDNVYPAVDFTYIPDPNLHFEIVQGFDVGLDLRALNNRLSAEINYYNKTTDGILTSFTLPAENKTYFTNLGKLTNKGIEVTLGWNDKIGEDFTYNVSGNFSYNKNIVNSIGNTSNFQIIGNGGANLTETGNSVGYFYGYRQVGIYQSTADLDKQPRFANSLPGDIAYEDVNGDGVISPADRTYLGTPFPPYSYGLTLSAAYKGFDATVQGQGVAGNKIYTQRRTANFAPFNYESNRLNAWTGPGTSNVEPIVANRGNNLLFSSYFLESGSFFRLRNVQLGYTFNNQIFGKTGIQKLRIFVSGQNVVTWSKVSGYTPEPRVSDIIGGGADNGVYPVPAVYSVGLNVTF